MRPSPAISPPGASAHHCAVRYAQSTPTYFTSGLLPDGIGHRRVSPARRPFFMTFHKFDPRGSIQALALLFAGHPGTRQPSRDGAKRRADFRRPSSSPADLRLGDLARISEDEEAEVSVASQDNPVAVLVLRQSHPPEVVSGRVDVPADLPRAGRVREVDHAEPARVPGEVGQLVGVDVGTALIRVAPRHLDLVHREVTEADGEGRIAGLRDGELTDLGRVADQ